MASFEITKLILTINDDRVKTLKLKQIKSRLENCENKTATGFLKCKHDGQEKDFIFAINVLGGEVFLKPIGGGPLYSLEQQGRKLYMKDK